MTGSAFWLHPEVFCSAGTSTCNLLVLQKAFHRHFRFLRKPEVPLRTHSSGHFQMQPEGTSSLSVCPLLSIPQISVIFRFGTCRKTQIQILCGSDTPRVPRTDLCLEKKAFPPLPPAGPRNTHWPLCPAPLPQGCGSSRGAGGLLYLLFQDQDALPLLWRKHGDLVCRQLENLHDERGLWGEGRGHSRQGC